MTTLTREILTAKCKQRYEVVEIPEWGQIGIRSTPEVKRTQRFSRMYDDNGQRIEQQRGMRRVYQIIDQVMADENTPMFTDADAAEIAQWDGEKLDYIMAAIVKFNGETEGNEQGGSND